MNTVLGIDLGTQSLKVVFYNYETKQIQASASRPLTVQRDDHGAAEQEASAWLAALQQCCAEIPGSVKQSVRAIGVSGQQHGFVALDASDQVLCPVKLWCDTATQDQADAIHAACGGRERVIEVAGNPILVGYTASKIRWLKDSQPQAYARLAHILLPHDFLNFVLTGIKAMEYGDASGTGLLNVRTRAWSDEVCRAVDEDQDLKALLPPLIAPDEPLGTTVTDFARACGLPLDVPVAPGGGDNMMAAIGTGNVVSGQLTMSLGSSGTLFAYSDRAVVDPSGDIAGFCSSTGGWLPLVCTMNCTLGTELVRMPLGVGLENFEQVLNTAEPGAGGLLTLPFFGGERMPNLPNARGSILGISPDNFDAPNLLRSQVEAATYGLKYGLEALVSLGIEAREITLTGGGANSPAWRQIVADIFELQVVAPEVDEGAALGAALQALWILSCMQQGPSPISSITNEHVANRPSTRVEPQSYRFDVYREHYDRYLHAVDFLAGFY